jgi:DNA (cytosine-5)-methyltransferase 1
MGYRTTWGIFSASECGAPHQRKRVFILAHNDSERSQELARQVSAQSNTPTLGTFVLLANSSSQRSTARLPEQESRYERQSGITQHGGCEAWPSRPGEQQYGWEPPRVVGDTSCEQNRGLQQPGIQSDTASAGPELADSHRFDRSAPAEGREHDRKAGSSGERQTQPPLGGDPDGPSSGLDYAELCITCDNRTDELRLLGNGVVPATAERAFRTLIKELDDSENSR